MTLLALPPGMHSQPGWGFRLIAESCSYARYSCRIIARGTDPAVAGVEAGSSLEVSSLESKDTAGCRSQPYTGAADLLASQNSLPSLQHRMDTSLSETSPLFLRLLAEEPCGVLPEEP